MGTAHISRLEGSKAVGWQVRVGPKRGYHSKMFSDVVFGSKGMALVEAERYLADFLKRHPELGPPEDGQAPNQPYFMGLMANNQSGVNGVYRSHEYLDSGEECPYWGAFVPVGPQGRKMIRVFRVTVYGEEQARRLAIAYRRSWELACDRGELERFFAEADYPATFEYEPVYYGHPDRLDRKVHIERQAEMVWCGKYLERPPWEEMGEPPEAEQVCQDCRRATEKYERLMNMLRHYVNFEG